MFSSINDIYNYCNFIANKQQSGSISSDEFNISINAAQQEYLKIKLGLPELFTVEKRESPQQFQTSQSISDSLRPFIKSTNITKSGDGFALPSDFAAWGNNDYLYVVLQEGQNIATRQPCEFVTLGERAIRLNNYIKYPTVEYPIATYLNNLIKIDPDDVTMVNLQYVRYPVTPFRNYTVNADDQEIYNPTGSIQLEFPQIDWENIANIVLKYWATFLRDNELFQVVDSRIKTGM